MQLPYIKFPPSLASNKSTGTTTATYRIPTRNRQLTSSILATHADDEISTSTRSYAHNI